MGNGKTVTRDYTTRSSQHNHHMSKATDLNRTRVLFGSVLSRNGQVRLFCDGQKQEDGQSETKMFGQK
jgi:hypothetical protein